MYALAGLTGAVLGAITWVSRKKERTKESTKAREGFTLRSNAHPESTKVREGFTLRSNAHPESTKVREGFTEIPIGKTATQVFDEEGKKQIQTGAKIYSDIMELTNVVTDPKFRSDKEARAYANDLQNIAGKISLGADRKIIKKLNTDVLVPTDVENNVIEYTRRCEEVRGTDSNPFADTWFANHCGFCHEGGETSQGTPTIGGLFISQETKEATLYNSRREGARTPAYSPTIGSCRNGYFSVSSDGYEQTLRRVECEKKGNYSVVGCVQCADNKRFVYVDPSTARAPIRFNVKGVGKITFTHKTAAQTFTLKEGETKELTTTDPIEEGENVFLRVEGDAAYVAGYMYAPTATGVYEYDIGRMAEVDTVTGGKPRISGSTTVGTYVCTMLRPAAGKREAHYTLYVPYTFIEPNEDAALECPSAPFITKEASATKLGSGACFTKEGVSSLECVRQLWTDAGCTPAGSDYPRDAAAARALAAGRSLGAVADDFYGRAMISNYGVDMKGKKVSLKDRDAAAQRCTGKKYGDPCSVYEGGATLGADCLDYLYKESSCRASGSRAPIGADGRENKVVVDALQKLGGVDAVRKHYRDLHSLATNNSAADRDREAAVEQCFGTGFHYNRPGVAAARSYQSTWTNPTAGQSTSFERISYSYPQGVKPVVVLGKYGIAPWGSAGFSDKEASWIWSERSAKSQYALVETPAFYYLYNHVGSSPSDVRVDFIADNEADIYVNGELIGSGKGGWGGDYIQAGNRKQARILPGNNIVKVVANNRGGEAGFLMAAFDVKGTVLFRTDGGWKAGPAYVPIVPTVIADMDGHKVDGKSVVENLKGGTDGLWNPIGTAQTAGGKIYRLRVQFDRPYTFRFLRFTATADRVHDPTGIRIYRDESKSELVGTYGSMVNQKVVDVQLNSMSFNTDKLYIEIDKATQYQIWLRSILFYANV
jgi:hypothetical protein